MKKKIGELYDKPIVIGNKNKVKKHEIHIDELNGGEGGGSSVGEDDMLFFDVQKLISTYELSGKEAIIYFSFIILPNKSLVYNTTKYLIDYNYPIPKKFAIPWSPYGDDDIELINYIGVSSKIMPIGDILIGSNSGILKENVKSVSLYDFIEEAYSAALQGNEYWVEDLPEDFIDRLKSVEVKKEEIIKWMEEPVE